MAQSRETGNPTVTADNPITDLLAAPLSPDWTVEGLAEQLLAVIAAQGTADVQEFVLDADATTDRQSRRVLRPLLACLATKSAAEGGTPANLYGGCLSFQRPGPKGPVWILGQFENAPGTVRVAFRRSSSPPQNSEPRTVQPPVNSGAGSRPDASQTGTSRPAGELHQICTDGTLDS
jgi:hypothetical protein